MIETPNWPHFLSEQKQQPYMCETLNYVRERRASGHVVFPEQEDVFSAFNTPSFEDIKVVIIGQDPYHGEGQAHGLCFSVQHGIKTPPSLINIYKELAQDVEGFTVPTHGYLMSWANQGVMLLNTVLTVEEGQAHSHKHLGWEQFTDKAINYINDHKEDVVFILWGAHAQKKGKAIDANKHHILKGPHPSPLSAHRGFFGCKHFSKTNQLLSQLGKKPIEWQL